MAIILSLRHFYLIMDYIINRDLEQSLCLFELYRFMDEKYVDEYITDGTIRISRVDTSGNHIDRHRMDSEEGRTQSSVVVTGSNLEIPIYTTRAHGSYCSLCFSMSPYSYRGVNKSAYLKVVNVAGLINAITEKIQDQYRLVEFFHGPCIYRGRDIKYSNDDCGAGYRNLARLLNIQEIEGLFIKDKRHMKEHEYRFVWHIEQEVEEIYIKIDNPTAYAEKELDKSIFSMFAFRQLIKGK